MTNDYLNTPLQDYLIDVPQITFNKLVYRRYTDFDIHKEKYKFKDNQVLTFCLEFYESLEFIN